MIYVLITIIVVIPMVRCTVRQCSEIDWDCALLIKVPDHQICCNT